jgi:antirestriction protein ArdC
LEKQKKSVFTLVTERILDNLYKDIVPWDKPWNGGEDCATSYITGKPYSSLNQMLLDRSGQYLTGNQLKTLKGKHLKHSGNLLVYYELRSYREFLKEEGGKMNPHERTSPKLTFFMVYNVEDCEGIDVSPREAKQAENAYEKADRIIESYIMRESLNTTKTVNFQYDNKEDVLGLAPIGEDLAEYYAAIFRMLIHSTGYKTRLNRDMGFRFGHQKYGKEELIGEIGSAYLCHKVGIFTSKRSETYKKEWARVFRANNYLFVSAANKAERAAKYILTGERPKEY